MEPLYSACAEASRTVAHTNRRRSRPSGSPSIPGSLVVPSDDEKPTSFEQRMAPAAPPCAPGVPASRVGRAGLREEGLRPARSDRCSRPARSVAAKLTVRRQWTRSVVAPSVLLSARWLWPNQRVEGGVGGCRDPVAGHLET
jgi:hypothetical protein